MDFGLKLKEKRAELSLSQSQLADSLGVTRQTIANWEKGKTYPDIVSIIKFSDLYDISLDELLKGDTCMKKHVEKTAVLTGKLWNHLFVISILLLPSSMLLTHWNFTSAGLAIKLLGMILLLMVLVFRWKMSGRRRSELAIGVFFWAVFFIPDLMSLFVTQNAEIPRFTFEYILLGIILLYSYGTCFKTKLAFCLTIGLYFGAPIFAALSTHLPAIMEEGVTQAQNIWGNNYRVEEILYQEENAKIPSLITLDSDGETLIIDHVAVGQFSKAESEAGDSWTTWNMIPKTDPVGRVILSSLNPSGSGIRLEYRIDRSTPEQSKYSTLWSVELEPVEKRLFTIEKEQEQSSFLMDWYSTELTPESKLLHSDYTLEDSASAAISVADDSVSRLTVLEEYHCDDNVEIHEYIVTRNKKGVFPFPEDLIKRYEKGEQFSFYRIHWENGEYLFRLNYE